MVNENLLNQLNAMGFGADVDALETYVGNLQDAAAMGEPIVTDDVYDQYYRLLKQLKPDSEVVGRNWEKDDFDLEDNDELLKEYGMASITTMKAMDEMGKFTTAISKQFPDGVNLHVSYKLNGHGVRAVYRYGELVSGSTRGRSKKGRDITRHLKHVLPNHVSSWENERLVEVRGELLVSFDNFEKRFKTTLKTPLSAVTSLVRDSVTEEELQYLDMLCYNIFVCDESTLKFKSLSEKFQELGRCGFRTPEWKVAEDVGYWNLDDVAGEMIESFEERYRNREMPYYCDGLVACVDDLEQFEKLGYDGKNHLGNMAWKIGETWGAKVYVGTIEEVVFVPGKKFLTPKALIYPVRTVGGPEVTTVPLYNVGVMEDYGLVPGSPIYFTFGGETGVTLVDSQGRSIGDQRVVG